MPILLRDPGAIDCVNFMNGFRMTVGCKSSLVFLVAVAFHAQVFAPAVSAQDILEEVRAGNKSALESIRTLSCRITLASPTSQRGPMAESTADYWQSGDSWRVHFQGAGQVHDSVGHDSIIRRLTRSEKRTRFVIKRAEPDEPPSRFDPYGRGLLKLCGPKGWSLTLEELLHRPHKLGKVTRESHEGREYIVLKISIKLEGELKGDFEIWFDPQVNYLARKLIGEITSSTPTKTRRESQVLRFLEAAPGVYFPVEAETKFYNDGKLAQHDVVTFSEIRVNQPLAPNLFELPIPPNSTVSDSIQDREYQVDAQGKAFGPERSLIKFAPLPAGSAQTETMTEPESVTRWIVYALLGVLAIAGGIWYVRRLRATAISG